MFHLLALSALAAPSTYSDCSVGSPTTYTAPAACACLAAAPTSVDWWKTAGARLKSGLTGGVVVQETCYDWAETTAGVVSSRLQDKLIAHGESAYSTVTTNLYTGAGPGKYVWHRGSESSFTWETSGSCTIVSKYSTVPSPFPGVMPIVDNATGQIATEVQFDPSNGVSHIITSDHNDDQVMDMTIVFFDGTMWDSVGPFEPNHPITAP